MTNNNKSFSPFYFHKSEKNKKLFLLESVNNEIIM